MWRRPPSHAAPTDSVLVNRMGLSIVPSSATCVRPATFPYAFTAWYAPSTFSS